MFILRSSRKLSFRPRKSIDRSSLIFFILPFLSSSPARGSFSSMNIFASLSKLFYPSALYLVYLHRCFKRRRFYAFHEEVSKRQFPFPFQWRGIVKNPINVVTEFPFLFIRSFLRPLRGGGGIGCLSSHVSFFSFFPFFGEGIGGWSLV